MVSQEGWSQERIDYYNKISEMRWSYSRLTALNSCAFCFYHTYIMNDRGEGNAFAEVGTLMHDILERYHKGELSILELEDLFTDEFSKIGYSFPPNNFVDLAETYYEGCMEYLSDPDLVDLVDYNVLETELEINVDIGGYKFIGFVDLVLEHKATGNLIVADYKSKAKFVSNAERDEYARQLYIYSKGVVEKYGKYPTMLMFIHFRKQKYTKIRFDEATYKATLKWAVDTIEEIKMVDEFPVKLEQMPFFTKYMCNHRNKPNHRQGCKIII